MPAHVISTVTLQPDPQVKDGTTPGQSWQPAFTGVTKNFESLSHKTNALTGASALGWGIYRLTGPAAEIAAAVALAGVWRLPAVFTSLQTTLGVLSQAQRTAFITILTNHGVTAALLYDASTTVRTVLQDIIHMHDPLQSVDQRPYP